MKTKGQKWIQTVAMLLSYCTAFVTFAATLMAQAAFSTSTTPDQARIGGGAELVGDIVLHVETGTTAPGTITLTFSTDLLDNASEITLTGGVATGASVNIFGSVLVVSNIAVGQGPCNELRISGVRVDGRGLGLGARVDVTFSGGGGNTIVSGQTQATVISAFSEAKTVTVPDAVLIVNTGGRNMNSFTITEGFPSAWTDATDEAPGGGTNGLELDFWIENVPDQAELSFWTSAASTISGTMTADGGDLPGPVDLCVASTCGVATTTITADGTDTEFTLSFTGPNPGAGEEIELWFFLDISESTGVALPTPETDVNFAVTVAPNSDTVIPFFDEALMPDPHASLFSIFGGCVLLNLTGNYDFTDNTLTLNVDVNVGKPVTWNLWMSVQQFTFPLFSFPADAVKASFPIPFTPFPQIGTVGFLTTMTTVDEGILCSDWEPIDTGTPAVMPTARELKGLFGKSAP